MLITFEGIDGSGKTTQINLLADLLEKKGHSTLKLREPGSNPVSEKIRDILLDKNMQMSPLTELFLFEAARAELVENKIIPALKAGKTVLLDRFYDSTTAYQGCGRNLSMTDVEICNSIASKGIKPDLTFFLDVSLKISQARFNKKNKDRIENAGNDFFAKVIQGFRDIALREPERFHLIDASGGVEETHRRIAYIVLIKKGHYSNIFPE